jgi:hypothetical protein
MAVLLEFDEDDSAPREEKDSQLSILAQASAGMVLEFLH